MLAVMGKSLLVIRMVATCDYLHPSLEVRGVKYTNGVFVPIDNRLDILNDLYYTKDPVILSYEVRLRAPQYSSEPHSGLSPATGISRSGRWPTTPTPGTAATPVRGTSTGW